MNYKNLIFSALGSLLIAASSQAMIKPEDEIKNKITSALIENNLDYLKQLIKSGEQSSIDDLINYYELYLLIGKLEHARMIVSLFKECDNQKLQHAAINKFIEGSYYFYPSFEAVLKTHIKTGIDINIPNQKKTLLQEVLIQYPCKLKILLDNGADIFVPNQDGKSAYDIALEKNQLDLLVFKKEKLI